VKNRAVRSLFALAAALLVLAGGAEARPTDFYILALSWEPAFCEGHAGKPECRSLSPDRFDAGHLVLHGLWPQPRSNVYCTIGETLRRSAEEGRWSDLPEPDLTQATRRRLAVAMPGSQSLLERHEWLKHGTCYPGPAEAYFARALDLLDEVNGSAVQALLADRVGQDVTTDEVRLAFDRAFGAGAGLRVKVACSDQGGRRLVSELTLGLAGDVTGSAGLASLLSAAPPTGPGCPGGLVDPAGQP
jgi:ribonuclease T2